MNTQKKSRLVKITFAILLALVVWGIVGSSFWPITATSYWGVGLGALMALIFIFSLYIEKFGFAKAIVALISTLIIVLGALILNRYRGWPFGLITYNDILGWKMFKGISWPIPLFWSFITMSCLLLTQPKQITQDPKVLFSWAFDTAAASLLVSVIVEPILTTTSAEAWSTNGLFHGVPLSSFVGWFLTVFVASSIAVLTAKLWQNTVTSKPQALFLVFSGLSLLGLCASIRLSLPIPQILCLGSALYSTIMTYRLQKAAKNIQEQTPAAGDKPSAT